MKTIPASDFAVVYDRERKMIVSAGFASQMYSDADTFNDLYQSSAYVVHLWNEPK